MRNLKAVGTSLVSFFVMALGLGIASSAQAEGLINGSFEQPVLPPGPNYKFINEASVPGWQTTATDNLIEIWANGFLGVISSDGNQHAELNATQSSTLFQDATDIAAGSQVGFTFDHRARVGVDTMQLTITDLGVDNLRGGVETAADTVLFQKQYSTGTADWATYDSFLEAPIFALGNNIRFAYSAISTGSGNASIGNFIDNADFGVNVATSLVQTPEPASILSLLVIGMLGVETILKRKSQK